MKKSKEETMPLSKYQFEVDSMRMNWSNDVKKMMKLWDNHQRLIGVLEDILKTQEPGVLLGEELRGKITTEIERAKGVKL